MEVILAFNGLNEDDIETQMNMICISNPSLSEKIDSIFNYYPLKKINNKEKWIIDSLPNEICDVIYESIKQREEDLKRSMKPIKVINKGIKFFDAMILSLLIIKGLTEKEAIWYIKQAKDKYFAESANRLEININLINYDKVDKDKNEKSQERLFEKYSLLLKKYLYSDTLNGDLQNINLTISDNEINCKIDKLIEESLEKQISKPDRLKQIIAIGGLSESGKSSTGRFLLEKYNIPNFKFNYINNVVKKTYGISEDQNLFKNNVRIIAILVINEILSLLKIMYYWDMVSFESLHDFKLTEKMKSIIPENFNILFLKTSKENRINRNIKDVGSLKQSKEEVEKKDKVKISRGAAEIEKIADYIIENNKNLDNLENLIYNTLKSIENRRRVMRNRAGGLLIENGRVLLMHRIKKIDGEVKEYYVVPGGGIEDGETLVEATKRELKEEIGIDIDLVSTEPLLTLECENGTQYFNVVKKSAGVIGTGTGPEFTDSSYSDRGIYSAEMIPIEDIINGKINMVPEIIRREFIKCVNDLNKDINSVNSSDFEHNVTKMML